MIKARCCSRGSGGGALPDTSKPASIAAFYRFDHRSLLSQSASTDPFGLLILAAGFSIVLPPWLVIRINPELQPFVIQKLLDMIQSQITPAVSDPPQEDQRLVPISQDGFLLVRYEPAQEIFLPPFSEKPIDTRNLAGGNAIQQSEGETGEATFLNYLKFITSHFIHNYVTSVIALPDVLSRSGIKVLAQRDYWSDSGIWDGRISASLLGYMMINLALVSTGVAFSWKKHRWGGLIPLAFFLVYNLAISVSLTSGRRYIIPINWTLFYYYGIAFVFLVDSLKKVFKPQTALKFDYVHSETHGSKHTSVAAILNGLVSVALLIPAAFVLVPRLIRENPAEKARTLFSLSNISALPADESVTGTILYPTYIPRTGAVEFDFYTGGRVQKVKFFLFEVSARAVMDTRLEPVNLFSTKTSDYRRSIFFVITNCLSTDHSQLFLQTFL